MAKVAAELAEVRARAGGAPPGPAGPAALERDAIVTIVQDSVRPEMAALTKRVKAVESSVKSFSEKLGSDVEVWQAAVNTELQQALTKVKDQLKLHEADVEALRKAVEERGAKSAEGGGAPVDGEAVNKRLKVVESSVKSFSEKLGADVEAWQKAMNAELQSDVEALTSSGGAPGGEGAKLPVDASAAQAALQKRVKVLEATLAAHEMALQAHTETLEAHATWLE